MKKKLAALGMSAALLGGGAAGTVLMAPTIASAESSSSSSSDSADAEKQPGAWVSDALATLVDDGTLTQAQADAVTAALEEARPEGGPGGPGGPGMGRGGGPGLEAAATALGVVLTAFGANLIFKLGLVAGIGGRTAARHVALGYLLSMAGLLVGGLLPVRPA